MSQAVQRLETELGEQVFDRSSKSPVLTEAGRILEEYGQRLLRLTEETQSAVRELRDLHRGRVLIGTNEAGVHGLLPLIKLFRDRHPKIQVDVRRVHARQIAVEVQQGSLDAGVLTFEPPDAGLRVVPIATDELLLLVPRKHPLAASAKVTMEAVATHVIIAHNEPSPARDRVLRLFERRQLALQMMVSLPSIDGIKRAVEMNLGVALLPRRCAVTELARGHLVAVHVIGVSRRRRIFLVWRDSTRSYAARAFVEIAQNHRSILEMTTAAPDLDDGTAAG